VAPGVGSLLNFVPGWIVSGYVSQVPSTSLVNESPSATDTTTSETDGLTAKSLAAFRSALGVNPPRLEPFASTGASGAEIGDAER
jgi:hypothetical protein